MKNRDIILILGTLSFLSLVVLLSLLLANHLEVPSCGCPHMVSHNFIYLFIILAVIFVGSLLYYLFSLKIDSQIMIINKNIEVLYSILDNDEKSVLNELVNNNGEINQSELSESHGKLKAHRVLKKLKNKKIINVIKHGKSNIIKLNKELKRELVNKS